MQVNSDEIKAAGLIESVDYQPHSELKGVGVLTRVGMKKHISYEVDRVFRDIEAEEQSRSER